MAVVIGLSEFIELLSRPRDELVLAGLTRTFRTPGEPAALVQRIFVAGDLLRVEEPPGQLDTILGVDAIWHRWPESGKVVRKPRDDRAVNPYTQPAILTTGDVEYWRDAITQDVPLVESSFRAVEIHGRPAIAATFAGKNNHQVSILVDQGTGVWLEARIDGEIWLDWLEVDFEASPEAAWFLP